MSTSPTNGSGPSTSPLDQTRTKLALWMVVVGVVIVGAISAVALMVPQGDENRLETTRLIFAAAVPLVGTWVGTVLAFYFTSDNLKAAAETARSTTETTVSLLHSLSPSTPVANVMTGYQSIQPKLEAADADAQKKTLDELYKAMTDVQRSRLPIFDPNRVPLYVVHQADIEKYAAKDKSLAVGSMGPASTFKQLVDDSEIEPALKAFAAIGPQATVADARRTMDTDPRFKDLFVTVDGTITGAALGWITNSDLARKN